MELTERLEWFMKMLRCKYPADMQEYDSSLTPCGDLRRADTGCCLHGGGWLHPTGHGLQDTAGGCPDQSHHV